MSQTITVPIFPLDGVLLIPGCTLQLYIFEPRYQEMLTWALEHDRRIAMAIPSIGHSASAEHQPPVREIAGLGEISKHHAHPNGHADIELQGISRIRITDELPQAWDFRIAQAEVLVEDQSDIASIAREIPDVLQFLHDADPDLHAQLNGMSPQQIIDLALIRLPVETELKLQIYAEPVLLVRLRMINRVLEIDQAPRPDIEIGPQDPRRN